MSTHKSLVCAILPLFWATAAFSQGVPANPPSRDSSVQQPAMSHPGMMHREEDPVVRHKTFCGDRYAHEIGRLAYLEAKLDLTEKQRSAWHKWQQWQMDGADKEQVDCLSNTPKPEGRPTALDMEAQMEKALSIKLQSLQSSRPSLEALYEALTPAQRAILDRPPHGDHIAPPHGEPHEHFGPIPPEH
jgi:hypothetical protein